MDFPDARALDHGIAGAIIGTRRNSRHVAAALSSAKASSEVCNHASWRAGILRGRSCRADQRAATRGLRPQYRDDLPSRCFLVQRSAAEESGQNRGFAAAATTRSVLQKPPTCENRWPMPS